MATYTFEKIQNIIKNNPNKHLINSGQEYSNKLRLHMLGDGINSSWGKHDYFESDDIFRERTNCAKSNKDLFARLLQREEMVFNAKGGSMFYSGLSEEQTRDMDALLDSIRFDMSIRKWVKEFALSAYRVDPMGVLFVEQDAAGTPYPTYKSIASIFDYLPNGRKLEYVCFKLAPSEARALLVDSEVNLDDPKFNVQDNQHGTMFFRFVDDSKDYIIENNSGNITSLHEIDINGGKLPALRASDILDFNQPSRLLSPLDKTIELADSYKEDRSVRDLSKKFHGFPKAFEPQVMCDVCRGTGLVQGKPCPSCTTGGAEMGSGIKLRTKVSDVLRFPLPPPGVTGGLQNPGNFFGYSTPPVEIWDKQDSSLNDIENDLNDTYWGTTKQQSTSGPSTADTTLAETATKTKSDLQPIYARLNATADWAEKTENMICDFIGRVVFGDSFKKSARTYGRYYILETPDELIEQYLDQRNKGASQTTLFDTLRKYYHSLYSNDPVQLAINLKLIDVEPFVHKTVTEVQTSNPSREDYNAKLYYSEWLATKEDAFILTGKVEKLIEDLRLFATNRAGTPEQSLTPPQTKQTI